MKLQTDVAWHLDKKVPLGIIITIILQTLVFIWWFSAWQADVTSRLLALEKAEKAISSHEGRLVIVEQRLNYIVEGIGEIKASVRELGARNEKVDRP